MNQICLAWAQFLEKSYELQVLSVAYGGMGLLKTIVLKVTEIL